MNLKEVSQLVLEILKKDYGIPQENVVGVYPFGSITYGTQTTKSDYDFVIIVDCDLENDYQQYESQRIDIHIMTTDHYKTLLDKHDIMALETYFNPMPILKFETDFTLDKVKLRHKVSSVTSNSWVKAKKKVTLEGEDDWIGYKSLFHSMRILQFGIQLAKNGEINNFKCANGIWEEIKQMVEEGRTIQEIMAYFKPIYNDFATQFRILAPKA